MSHVRASRLARSRPKVRSRLELIDAARRHFALSLPHTLAKPPPPHVCGGVQSPHVTMPPHPSATGPQLAPRQVRGVHDGMPHTPGLPLPPHVSLGGQVPQSSCPPQPSPLGPQSRP